ncbi:O-antigen ligase family protein [Castellaniella ginsengisoli]
MAGLIAATMTRLRPFELPLGLGEVLLLLFVLAALFEGLQALRTHWLIEEPRPHVWLIGSYAVFFLMLMVGCWQGNHSGMNPYTESVRDMLAYALCFLVSAGVVVNCDGPDDVARTLRCLTWAGLSVSAIIWIWAVGFGALGGFNLWYGGYGARFTGLAVNPNQNALLLVSMPFLLCFLFRTSVAGIWERRAGICLGAIGLAAGWGTGSAALRFIWVALIPVAILAGVGFQHCRRSLRVMRDYIWTLGLGIMLILLSSESVLSRAYDFFSKSTGDVFPGMGVMNIDRMMLTDGAGWTDRLTLWKNAWLVIQGSPVFGYGPGPLSGMSGPFGGSEAHNSLLDWMMATGFVGGVALTALVSVVLWRSVRRGNLDLFFALLALLIFSMAHHVLRHPWVWAMLTLLAVHAGGLHGKWSRAGNARDDAKVDVTCVG